MVFKLVIKSDLDYKSIIKIYLYVFWFKLKILICGLVLVFRFVFLIINDGFNWCLFENFLYWVLYVCDYNK